MYSIYILHINSCPTSNILTFPLFLPAGLGGVNIMEKLEAASAEDEIDGKERGKLLLDFSATTGDRIQVFVE